MKKFVIILFAAFCCFGYVAAQVPDSLKFQSLPPAEFQKRYLSEADPILIDVREFFEFRGSRIKNAVNIPSSGNLEMTADTLDKNASLFLYCYSGMRSRKAARLFYDKGFRKLYNLDGGITRWKKEGMRIDRRKVKKI